MIKLLSMELDNVVYFQHAELKVDQRPFTVISGYNKDSLISNQTNNGAGKSLLMSAIPNLLYEATPLESGRASKKAMLSGKTSKIATVWQVDKDIYEIVQYANKTSISKNGTDAEIRLAKDQRARVSEIFPLSEDEFYSYVYLQSQRPLNFIIAQPAARLHYITELFDLNVYDKLKAYFTAKLGEIKDKQVEMDVVTSAHLRTVQLLERLNWSEADGDKLEAATKFIEKNRSRLRKQQSKVAAIEKAEADRKELEAAQAELKRIGKTKSIDWIEQTEDKLRAFVRYEEELEEYREFKSELDSAIKKLGEPLACQAKSISKQESLVDKLEDKLTVLVETRKEYMRIREERSELEDELKAIRPKKIIPKETLEASQRHCLNVLEFESILHDCDDGECPTCLQSVDVSRYRKQIDAAKKELKTVKAGLHYHKIAAKLDALELPDFDEKAYKKLVKQYKKLVSKLDEMEEQQETFNRQQRLNKQMLQLEKPDSPSGSRPKHTLEELRDMRRDSVERKRLESIIEVISVEHLGDLKSEKAKLRKIEQQYDKHQSTAIQFSSRQGEYRTLIKERKKHEQDLKALRPIIEQRDLFKSMEKAYSNRGLKVNAANNVLAQIEKNLNQYANLIFAEPFQFNLRAEKDGVHCDVDRGNGKVSDIRRLSGAETDSFRLLWMWVLLIMAEPSKRTNFVVLDEPDSHMDQTTRDLFIERFIPALRTMVPNLYLVTPKDKHKFTDCSYITVVKENGVSRLVEDEDFGSGVLLQPAGQSSGSNGKKAATRKKGSSVRTRARKKDA